MFDEDGSGDVDYKELVVGLEMFKETNLSEKLEVFFDLADVDGSGEIEEQELYDVLKINVHSYEERVSLKHAIKEIFRNLD